MTWQHFHYVTHYYIVVNTIVVISSYARVPINIYIYILHTYDNDDVYYALRKPMNDR